MVSRVMTAIVSKKGWITISRLVRSALQTLCKMSGEMDWFRLGGGEDVNEFIGVQLVVQQLCESPVARGKRPDYKQINLGVQLLRVDVVRFAVIVIVHLAHDGDGIVMVLNHTIVVQLDEAKV